MNRITKIIITASVLIIGSAFVYVDNIKVYTNITGGNVYDINNAPGPYLAGIRALNRNLK